MAQALAGVASGTTPQAYTGTNGWLGNSPRLHKAEAEA
jgi:hypothetical protein